MMMMKERKKKMTTNRLKKIRRKSKLSLKRESYEICLIKRSSDLNDFKFLRIKM